jgi:hypothetical protein
MICFRPMCAFLISPTRRVLHFLLSHRPWFDHPNNICWKVHIMEPPLCNFLRSRVTSSIFVSNILCGPIL